MDRPARASRLILFCGLVLTVLGLGIAAALAAAGATQARSVAVGAVWLLIATPATALVTGATLGKRLTVALGVIAVLAVAFLLEVCR
jgi:hypothetical protein